MSAPEALRPTLAERFLDNPHLLGVVLVLLLVAGASALLGLPRIEDPRITSRNALVLTTLPGATAARVESLITEPIEVALRELAEIKTVESTSRPGISLVAVELQDDIDRNSNENAFSRIRDKLDQVAPRLPAQAGAPRLDDERGAVAFSLVVAVATDGEHAPGLSTRLADDLADRLRALPGTELVRVYGEAREEIAVTVDRGESAALGLDPARIAALLDAADARQPAGALRGAARNILIEVAGEFDSLARIAAVPVADDGRGGMLRLADIATVEKSVQSPPHEIALADGRRAVLVAARVEDGVRLDAWTERGQAVVAAFARSAGRGVHVDLRFDQSRYTDARLALLSQNLLGGAALVMLVVLVGLGWRAALIVGAALPLSAAATLFGLSLAGQSVHQMSIFGMIIAVGLLIDNAIVVADRVSANHRAGLSQRDAVSSAVRHLKVPLLASTLTTVLGFMPVFLLPGNVGDFVSPIAISVILALVASLAIATTLIAALSGRFLTNGATTGRPRWWRHGWSNDRLTRGYRRALRALLARPLASALLAMTLPALGFVAATTLDMEFFPSADRDQFEVEIRTDANGAIEHTAALARSVEAALRRHPGVLRVDWTVGGSYPSVYYNLIMDQDDSPTYAHGIVTMADAAAAERLLPRLQADLNDRFTAAQIVVSAFGQGPPTPAPVAFRIAGPDTARLVEYGDTLRRILHETAGVVHTRATLRQGEAKLVFQVDEHRARAAGLTLGGIAAQLHGALEGARGGVLLEDLEALPVRVRFPDTDRADLGRIETLGIVLPDRDGEPRWTPAQALGEWVMEPELAAITRRNGERVNTVLATVGHGVLPMTVSRAVEKTLARGELRLAPGYRLETGGSSEEQGEAVGLLLRYAPVLAALMAGALVLSFRSVRLAGVVGLVAVLSVGLGMLSLWLAGHPIGFNPLIGSAGLIGVAINGSIVVLAALEEDEAARRGDIQAMVDVTVASTRHILATTFTTVGGFMPLLALMHGSFWPPLAVVIAGGVGLSVLLSLVFTPAVYRVLRRWDAHHRSHRPTRELAGSATPVSERLL